jgi:hypothetical protein
MDTARGRAGQGRIAGVAEHLGEAAVVARDDAVLGEQDAHRGVGHDGLDLHLRLQRVRHVFQNPDGAAAAVLVVHRAARTRHQNKLPSLRRNS